MGLGKTIVSLALILANPPKGSQLAQALAKSSSSGAGKAAGVIMTEEEEAAAALLVAADKAAEPAAAARRTADQHQEGESKEQEQKDGNEEQEQKDGNEEQEQEQESGRPAKKRRRSPRVTRSAPSGGEAAGKESHAQSATNKDDAEAAATVEAEKVFDASAFTREAKLQVREADGNWSQAARRDYNYIDRVLQSRRREESVGVSLVCVTTTRRFRSCFCWASTAYTRNVGPAPPVA